jgi:hypothetical protein
MMYSRAFGQMASGRLPEAEVMAQMGISKRDLAAEGIKFDKQGSLLSSAEATMTAFERIIYTKFDAAYKASTTTTEAMQASITDSFQSIQRSMGMAVNEGLKPFISVFGTLMETVANSNFAKFFGEDLIRPLIDFSSSIYDIKTEIISLFAAIAATATIMPQMFANMIAGFKALKNMRSIPDMIEGLKTFTKPFLIEEWVNLAKTRAFEYAGSMLMPTNGLGVIDEAQKRKPFLPSGGPALPEDSKTKKHKATVEHHLQRISNNTKKSADLLDLRNQTIGGGRLAALGITGAELASSGMRVRTELNKARPVSGDSMVTRGIKQMIQNNLGFAVNGGRSVPVR